MKGDAVSRSPRNLMKTNSQITLGVIVGNRGFFPGHLCDSGRAKILDQLERAGIAAVILPTDATKFGAVESIQDAQKRSEERRVGKECTIQCRSRWSPYH